jgi:hypothetical protein
MARTKRNLGPGNTEGAAAWEERRAPQIVWRKVTKNGRVGTGYRVRTCHEPVLLAIFGGRHRHKAFPSVFDGLAREHSRKPDEFYRMVLDGTPDLDRCDLFSRETRPGFDGWGKERGKFDRVAEGVVVVRRSDPVVTALVSSPCQIELSAGAARGIRTPDPIITNDVLYRLSYCGFRA